MMMRNDAELTQEQREAHSRQKKGFGWKKWSLFFLVLCALVAIIVEVYFNKPNLHHQTKSIAHAKQVLLALTEFEAEHGALPGQIHVDEGLIPGARADTANDCFRQMIQGLDVLRSEAIFYAPTRFTQQPDNDIGDESNHFAEACAKGEVGFIYFDAPTAKDGAPLIAAPLYDTKGRFDAEIYNGKAVILKTDGSVESVDIDPVTGRVYMLVDGKKVEIFSAENPLFRDPPMIKYPEPR